MTVVGIGLIASAAFGLSVGLSGQAGVPRAPLAASETQHLIGGITVESVGARQTRIRFHLATPTYLAKPVVLEADAFAMRQEARSGILIGSAGPVRVTGFTLGQSVITSRPVLRDAPDQVVTWAQGFTLRILADGTLEWGCCPRQE